MFSLPEKGRLLLILASVSLVIQQCTHRNADALVRDVDVDDLYLDNVAHGNDVLDILNTLVSQLRNVDQTVYAVNDLCECTERSDGNDSCIDLVANLVGCLELLPRIVFLLLVAQRNPVVLLVQILDVYFDVVANLDNFARCLLYTSDAADE